MSGVELPVAVRRLLVAVAADGFTLYCCGPRAVPRALVAAYDWGAGGVDLLIIRDFDRITTARVPAPGVGPVDVFGPEVVVWAYEGRAEPALWALLDLVHPAHPDAPAVEFAAPPGLRVPPGEQRPLTIRPCPPHRQGSRAGRLAARLPNTALTEEPK